MIVVDAKDLILGRLATNVAKKALLGETINIINCEKAVITGNKNTILSLYKRRMEMGVHTNGPFLPRMPDRFVRRTIRGMLPYKTPKGRDAYKRIMCFSGIPKEFASEKTITFVNANIDKLPYLKFITVKEICKFLGAKE
jgi:large subunit ribosomal protein L13